jgi:hypothetical protein
VNPVLVVVANILREQTLQMPLVYGNNVIQQVWSASLDPTLGSSILPGRSRAGSFGCQSRLQEGRLLESI